MSVFQLPFLHLEKWSDTVLIQLHDNIDGTSGNTEWLFNVYTCNPLCILHALHLQHVYIIFILLLAFKGSKWHLHQWHMYTYVTDHLCLSWFLTQEVLFYGCHSFLTFVFLLARKACDLSCWSNGCKSRQANYSGIALLNRKVCEFLPNICYSGLLNSVLIHIRFF